MGIMFDDDDDNIPDIQWLPGVHQWRDRSSCAICRVRRHNHILPPDVPGGPIAIMPLYTAPHRYSWELDGDWDAVCPPCRPRLNTVVDGLHMTKDVAKRIGITPNALSIRAMYRSLPPFAVLTKPTTYLWSDRQVELLTPNDRQWAELKEARYAEIAAHLARSGHGQPRVARDIDALLSEVAGVSTSLRNIQLRWRQRTS